MGAASGSSKRYTPFKPINPTAKVPERSEASSRRPWTVEAQTLKIPLLLHAERKVILTVGQPSAAALEALFESPRLASSLVIIACHKPPPIPSQTSPAVHILRLRIPLVLEDAGASRLIDIFEWALQVARIWRRTEGPRVQELLEELSPVNNSVKLSSTYGRLSGSVSFETSSTSLPSARLQRRWTLKSFRGPSRQREASERPFDAIINFLPFDTLEKSVLKAAILVTTMSRPYLVYPPHSMAGLGRSRSRVDEGPQQPLKPSLDLPKRTRRWSLFRGSRSAPNSSLSVNDVRDAHHSRSQSTTTFATQSYELTFPALTRARKARVLHLFPSNSRSTELRSSQAHLVRSIETFLLSFSFAPSSTIRLTGLPRMEDSVDSEKARPYILPAKALGEVLHVDDDMEGLDDSGEETSSNWSLLDLVLAGMLEDDDHSSVSSQSPLLKGKERAENENGWQSHRAWIGGVSDILIARRTVSVSELVIDEKMSPRPHPVRAPEEPRTSEISRGRKSIRSRSVSHPRPVGEQVPAQCPELHHPQAEIVRDHDALGSMRNLNSRPVEKPELNTDKRLPTPPQETPALITPTLRPRHSSAERRHRPVSPRRHRAIEPAIHVHRDRVRPSTSADKRVPQTSISTRHQTKYHRKGASHPDIPTPPDSIEGYPDTRTPGAPNIEDDYPPPRRYVPSVRRVDSPKATFFQSPRVSSKKTSRTPRAVHDDPSYESAEAYLAELDEFEQQRRRRRSRSQPQMVAQSPATVIVGPGSRTAPMSQITLSPVPAPYHPSRKDYTSTSAAKSRKAMAANPRRRVEDDDTPFLAPVRITGGNALGLRESPMVKASDISQSQRSSRRNRRHS